MSVTSIAASAKAVDPSPQNQHPLRFVTAASLFDGHDAAINIMRRILQASGVEVIHLAHNRSVQEIVEAAVQEDADAIAISSYQGGHIEYFKYLVDKLRELGAGHIKIFGGGGGVIIPAEINELHDYGVTRLYSPADGQSIGLQGMIDDMILKCRQATDRPTPPSLAELGPNDRITLTRALTAIENDSAWLSKAIKTMLSGSPLSALMIFEQLRRHRYVTQKEAFEADLVLATNMVRYPEFAEGVRALLIDKDKKPKWVFKHFSHVPSSVMESFFNPPWEVNPLSGRL